MLKTSIKKHNNRKGQAVVELALTLPILLLILGGIIDFGWIITNQNAIDYSAREGARYAIINTSSIDSVELIAEYTKSLTIFGSNPDMTVTVEFSNPDDPRSGDVIVNIASNVDVLTPIPDLFLQGDQVSLTSACRMKVE